MNPLELGCQGFHEVLSSLPHITPTLIFKIKSSTPFKCKYQFVSATFFIFIDVGEDLIMVDDATTPSNLLVMPIEEKELEKSSFDKNVSQWSCKEEPSKRVVGTQKDYSTWDCQLSFNPHALVIYLKFVPIMEPH